MSLVAIDLATGEPVAVGDTVTDFRGDSKVLREVVRANGEGHDGRVCVEGSPIAYYAGVFNLRVEATS